MTVSSIDARRQYIGDGTSVAFATFQILANSDLVVTLTDSLLDVDTVQILGTNYSVTGAGDASGAMVTFNVAPTVTQRVTVERVILPTQETHYVPNDPFPAASHEAALDKLTMLVQEANASGDRSLRLSSGDLPSTMASLPVLAARSSRVLGFDIAGNPVSGALITNLDAAVASFLSGAPIGSISAVASIATMQAFLKAGLVDGVALNVTGYYTAGDGGGGYFIWNATASASTNLGTSFAAGEGGSGRWLRVFFGALSVKAFGAKGDGVTIDTDSFKSAIATIKTIYLPEGTYLISPTGGSGDYMLYLGTQGAGGNPTSRNGMFIYGDGSKSIIKLGDAVGRSPLLFGGANGDSFDDMTFKNFAIDLNGANNLQTSYADAYRYNNAFYFFCPATNINFDGLYIHGGSGSQWIRIGNDSSSGYGENIRVSKCRFENFGIGLPSNLQQDVSVCYIQANGILVQNNSFSNADFTFDLARGHTALELHGDTSTIVVGNRFDYIQTPTLIVSSKKDNKSVIIEDNTYYQCNYLASLDPAYYSQSLVSIARNIYNSTKVASKIIPLGNSSENSKTREIIRFVDNIVSCAGNTNQGVHLFDLTSNYIRSLVIQNNDIDNLLGSLVYMTGAVQNSPYTDITIKGNRLDSLGATSGTYPNSPAFVHVETSGGTINALTITGNTLLNAAGKNYAAFGAFKLVGAIAELVVRDNDNYLSKAYPLVTQNITASTLKIIEAWSQIAPTIASANTIAPVTPIAFVSGSTTIKTITPLSGCQQILIPAAGATWVTDTSGNIALASTAVAGKALTLTYDYGTGKWYPSY